MHPLEKKYHTTLARYFLEKPLFFDETLERPNVRKCAEQPYQQAMAGMRDKVTETLFDPCFLQAKARCGLIDDLLNDFESASVCVQGSVDRENLAVVRRSLFIELYHIRYNPDITFQQLYNRLQWRDGTLKDAVERSRRDFLARNGSFYRQYRKPERGTSHLVTTLSGHAEQILACGFFPGSRDRIVSAGEDRTLKIWDAGRGKEIMTLEGHTNSVHSFSFSPDGKYVLSCSQDCSAVLWDVTTGRRIFRLTGHTMPVRDCCFFQDGSRAVTASFDTTLKVWDTGSGKETAALEGHAGYALSCRITRDGRFLLSYGLKGDFIVRNARNYEILLRIKNHHMLYGNNYDCSFQYGGGKLLQIDDGGFSVWIVEEKTVLFHRKICDAGPMLCLFSNDGTRILTGTQAGELAVWDAGTGNRLWAVSGFPPEHSSGTFSPDDSLIVTYGCDKHIIVWDSCEGRKIATLSGHSSSVTSCSFSADGQSIVSGGIDRVLKVWDLGELRETETYAAHAGQIGFIQYSRDGKYILSGDDTVRMKAFNSYKLWDGRTGELIRIFEDETKNIPGCLFLGGNIIERKAGGTTVWKTPVSREGIGIESPGGFQSYRISPDEKRILVSSGSLPSHTIDLRDADTLESIVTLDREAPPSGSDCPFSADSTRFVTLGNDKPVYYWNGQSRQPINPGDGKVLYVRDAASGEKLFALAGHTSEIGSYAFSPDGRFLLSWTGDGGNGEIRLWDMKDGRLVAAAEGDAASFSPDGRLIVAGYGAESIKLRSACTLGVLGSATYPFSGFASFTPAGNRLVLVDNIRRRISVLLLNGLPDSDQLLYSKALQAGDDRYRGRRIAENGRVFSSDGSMLEIFGADKTENFGCEALITHYAASADASFVSCGDANGNLYFLNREGAKHDPPVRTAVRIWHFGAGGAPGGWADRYTCRCRWCGKMIPLPGRTLDTISAINRDRGICPEDSPCLKLPDEAWEEPGLLSECSRCGGKLKFNPFVVDNRDRYD